MLFSGRSTEITNLVSVIEHFFQGNPDDCREKLSGCLVRYKGKWGYLGRYQARTQASFYLLGDKTINSYVELSTTPVEDFEVGPYNLGMINMPNGNIIFSSRDPVRKNKLGLREDNFNIRFVYGKETAFSFGDLIFNPNTPLLATLERQYPRYTAVLSGIYNREFPAKAFSPHFAAVRATVNAAHIFYKANVVGEADLKDGKITLYPSFAHLQQRLENFARVNVM
jgi:hypothetical protein